MIFLFPKDIRQVIKGTVPPQCENIKLISGKRFVAPLCMRLTIALVVSKIWIKEREKV